MPGWIEGYAVGSKVAYSDDFIHQDFITDRREGEFDMYGQTWHCLGEYAVDEIEGTFRMYERVK